MERELFLMLIPEVELDCGSISTSKVFFSDVAKREAKLIAVVVFPTPPF